MRPRSDLYLSAFHTGACFKTPNGFKQPRVFKEPGQRIEKKGVDGPHDHILQGPHGKEYHKSFSVQHGQPERVQQDVADYDNDEFGGGDPRKPDRLLIKQHSVQDATQDGVDGKSGEESAGGLDDIFQQIDKSAETSTDHRPEQVIHKFIGDAGKADFDVVADLNGEISKRYGDGGKHSSHGDCSDILYFTVRIGEQSC